MNVSRLQNSNSITKGRVLRYTLLPELLPRCLNLFGSGFRTLAFYIAGIFAAVRIFPDSHPYLRADNYQKYGLISVLAEGGRRVKWDRHHIDQISAYFIVLTGFIALLIQFLILGGIVFENQALAGNLINNAGDFNFFYTPTVPEQDYALRFLDLVFGLPDFNGAGSFFQSCVGGGVCNDVNGQALPAYSAWPIPMHIGLHSMLEFYNYTIIALAFVIIMYYFVTMLAETAAHGTFWGQRGNKTWIPVRVIFFAALIMPQPFYQYNYNGTDRVIGLNTAQILTLTAAYFGTGMASNAWREVNRVVGDELSGQHEDLIATPNRGQFPTSTAMVQFMTMVKTCRYAEQRINNRVIDAYIVKDNPLAPDNCLPLVGTSYAEALEFSSNEDIRIRFGERLLYNPGNAPGGSEGQSVPCNVTTPAAYEDMPTRYATEPGFVAPYCGEMLLTGTGPELLAELIKAGHYNLLVQSLWNDPDIDDFGINFTESAMGANVVFNPLLDDIRTIVDSRDAQIDGNIINAVDALLMSDYFDIPAALGNCGWMCASLYYNRIAEANGEIQTAIFTMPDISLWPDVLENVLNQRSTQALMPNGCAKFNPSLPASGGGIPVRFDNRNDLRVASIISGSYEHFCNEDLNTFNSLDDGDDAFRATMGVTGDSPIKDGIAMIFGISGLFDMRENSTLHPLAQLSVLGKGMVESTIRAFGGAIVGALGGFLPLEGAFANAIASTAGATSGIMMSLAMIGITIGFILFYVLPLLPFVYFIFAVAGWVKSIFEAMVGLPLWALAHLRLDGEGIIGPSASSGYFLILEILIRPILILTGFLASISIFMALVKVLNDSFDLVVANVGGFDATNAVNLENGEATTIPDPFTLRAYRNPIDQFFYTVIYAIIVYMMAISTFKLVDTIPQSILRWMGESVQTFGDFAGDPASGLMDRVGQGITLTTVLGGGLLGKTQNRNASINYDVSDPDPV